MNTLPTPNCTDPEGPAERVLFAWNQLNLVLGFFTRIDAKLSVILAVNLGMLAITGERMPPLISMANWMSIPFLLFILALSCSFYYLWRGAFPELGQSIVSVVYFKSVASMSEEGFRQAHTSSTHTQLADDLLSQIWRNSQILAKKFTSLRHAFLASLFAAIPWAVLLLGFTSLPETC
jgi:Family of unknown function (DUF5706)